MEKETIIFYLKYAMNYGKSVKIQTRNNKFMKVNILNVTSLTVNYSFINNILQHKKRYRTGIAFYYCLKTFSKFLIYIS